MRITHKKDGHMSNDFLMPPVTNSLNNCSSTNFVYCPQHRS